MQSQSWAIAQDRRGFIYVGNKSGVSVFDGSAWTTVPVSNYSTVRSLAVDPDGTVYVGAQGDFGYLTASQYGQTEFVSLRSTVAEKVGEFADVWGVHAHGDRVLFQTSRHLFDWDGSDSSVYSSDTGFHTSFRANGRIFVREREKGLMEYRLGRLSLVPDGQLFAEERIYVLLPYDQNSLLIGTRSGQFFLLDDRLTPLETDADMLLDGVTLYHATSLTEDLFALATFGQGVILMSAEGRMVGQLSDGFLLSDSVVNFVFVDREGGLWIATNNDGIYRIDLPTPLAVFRREYGLSGVIYDILGDTKNVYVATGAGLFVRRDIEGARAAFRRIESVPQTWALEAGTEIVLAASENGLFEVRGQEARLLTNTVFYALAKSQVRANVIYAGTSNGVSVLTVDNGDVGELGRFDLGTGPVYSLAEDEEGRLWIGTRRNGILVVPSLPLDTSTSDLESYGTSDGLPMGSLTVGVVSGRPVVASTSGLFVRVPEGASRGHHFVRSELDGGFDPAADSLLTFETDSYGRWWVVMKDRVEIAAKDVDDRPKRVQPAVLKWPSSEVARIFIEDSGVAWISRDDELLRYDPHVVKNYDVPYHAFVRGVSDLRTDSLLFGGNFRNDAGGFAIEQQPDQIPSFDFDYNNLRFVFAAPTFNSPQRTKYQYQLVGADDDWSHWSHKTTASYSSLREGSYEFRVRAQNGFGYLSEVGSYKLHILPPWYRTWWAFSIYGLGGLLLFTFSWKYVRMVKAHREAEQQARELARERVINERLNEANEQLQVANERLQEAATLKDEFLATTSHELRTPITAILGYASILREEIPVEYHEFIEIIEKSGERLMHTLNALLDLAKLRAGTMEVTPERVDMVDALLEVVHRQQPRAVERSISLDYNKPGQPIYVETDRSAVTKIFELIVDNAIKFTERGGISVSVASGRNYVRVSVADTGVGIDDEFIPVLFDEFRQESDGLSRTHSGNGLGLAITAKLVHLIGGTIHVNSRKGKGSTFVIKLPLSIGEPLEDNRVAAHATYGPDRAAMTRRRGDVVGRARGLGTPEIGETPS